MERIQYSKLRPWEISGPVSLVYISKFAYSKGITISKFSYSRKVLVGKPENTGKQYSLIKSKTYKMSRLYLIPRMENKSGINRCSTVCQSPYNCSTFLFYLPVLQLADLLRNCDADRKSHHLLHLCTAKGIKNEFIAAPD